MKQDEFERLNKILTEMEASAKTRADEQMFEAVRAGFGILERLVVALEKIAEGDVRVEGPAPLSVEQILGQT